jgi:hypothetical protein
METGPIDGHTFMWLSTLIFLLNYRPIGNQILLKKTCLEISSSCWSTSGITIEWIIQFCNSLIISPMSILIIIWYMSVTISNYVWPERKFSYSEAFYVFACILLCNPSLFKGSIFLNYFPRNVIIHVQNIPLTEIAAVFLYPVYLFENK